MALTINQLIVERRKTIAELRRKLRTIDSLVENQQRIIDRILKRRKKLPEVNDLVLIQKQFSMQLTASNVYLKALEKGYIE